MKKKIIAMIAMVVAAVICIGLIVLANPVPSYHVDPKGTENIMQINGTQIPANEYAAYFMSSKMGIEQQMAMYGIDSSALWGEDGDNEQMLDALRENTRNMLVQYHCILDKFQENNLKLDRAQIKEMQQYKKELIENYGGMGMFNEALVQQGLTEEMFDNSLLISNYARALNEYYFGEHGILVPSQEELLKAYHDTYLQAKHILINATDETGVPLTGDALEEKKALAEQVLEKAQAGEDFDALIAEYGEDPGMTVDANKAGYIFTEGDMVDEFYNGAKALEENQISGIVQSSYGYHIIMRMPLDETKMADYRDVLVFNATGKDFSTLMQEWMTEADVITEEEGVNKITISTAYDIAMTGVEISAPAQSEPEEPTENTNAE